MAAQLIDGKLISETMRSEIKREVVTLKEKNRAPGLAVVLVGDNPASRSYVTAKERTCNELGFYSRPIEFPESITEKELLKTVQELNDDPLIDGILVQLPLPKHINEDEVVQTILPEKDVDGFHPVNVGNMVLGKKAFYSCTPYGIVKMLEFIGVNTEGSNVVVIGRSNIVGKPMANLLIQKNPHANATVTVCHTRTASIKEHTLDADIVIVAAGYPDTLTADMVKPGAVVIDVGMNRVTDATKKRGYRLVGDVDFDNVKEVAGYITPVPGGVGPMTITMLMYNTLLSAKARLGLDSEE